MFSLSKVKASLTVQEWRWLTVLSAVAVISAGYIIWQISFKDSVLNPDFGGVVREGIVGQPRFLNPLLAFTSDVDRDITSVIYSGLMKFDAEGKLVPDLAEDFAVGDFGKTYDFFLRKNVQWHDGTPFTADDVIFTIERVQDPAFKSPLRVNWQGVTATKLDDYTVRISLRSPYAPFLANATLGILPKHIWEGVNEEAFFAHPANLKPVGTGPFRFESLKKDRAGNITSLKLANFKNHYFKPPYIESIEFRFFPNQKALINALAKGAVDAAGFLMASSELERIINNDELQIERPYLARYFAVFFNPEKKPFLKDKNLRKLLSETIDRQKLIRNVLNGEGVSISSPLAAVADRNTEVSSSTVADLSRLIAENGSPLSITLTTSALPQLEATARGIAEAWTALGIKTQVNIVPPQEIINNVIRPREFEALLFGQVLGQEPDPFSFWHSSQIKDPGLNLAHYQNKKVDEILEKLRQTLDISQREELISEFETLIVEDQAAIFLYNPNYLYIHKPKIKAVNIKTLNLPSDRFSAISDWYIKTKRVK